MQMLVAVVPFKDGISLFLQYFYCRFSGAQWVVLMMILIIFLSEGERCPWFHLILTLTIIIPIS
jgi:hypothetical protein